MGASKVKHNKAIGDKAPYSNDGDAESALFLERMTNWPEPLSDAEHLASRKKYEGREEIKTCLWFFNAMFLQLLAIATYVFAILFFISN